MSYYEDDEDDYEEEGEDYIGEEGEEEGDSEGESSEELFDEPAESKKKNYSAPAMHNKAPQLTVSDVVNSFQPYKPSESQLEKPMANLTLEASQALATPVTKMFGAQVLPNPVPTATHFSHSGSKVENSASNSQGKVDKGDENLWKQALIQSKSANLTFKSERGKLFQSLAQALDQGFIHFSNVVLFFSGSHTTFDKEKPVAKIGDTSIFNNPQVRDFDIEDNVVSAYKNADSFMVVQIVLNSYSNTSDRPVLLSVNEPALNKRITVCKDKTGLVILPPNSHASYEPMVLYDIRSALRINKQPKQLISGKHSHDVAETQIRPYEGAKTRDKYVNVFVPPLLLPNTETKVRGRDLANFVNQTKAKLDSYPDEDFDQRYLYAYMLKNSGNYTGTEKGQWDDQNTEISKTQNSDGSKTVWIRIPKKVADQALADYMASTRESGSLSTVDMNKLEFRISPATCSNFLSLEGSPYSWSGSAEQVIERSFATELTKSHIMNRTVMVELNISVLPSVAKASKNYSSGQAQNAQPPVQPTQGVTGDRVL